MQIDPSSFSVYWTATATVTGYQVYWSGGGGVDSGNMSAGPEDRIVTITGRTPGLTYTTTIVALSDHLPSPAVAVTVTLSKPRSVACMCHTEMSYVTSMTNAYCIVEDVKLR